MSLSKADLRKFYSSQRLELNLQERHKLSAYMLSHMEGLPWPKAATLLSYKPIAGKHEVPVQFFEEAIAQNISDLKICYPKTLPADGSMEAILYTDDTDWAVSTYGVEEPVNGLTIAPADIDIVFVPLLAFDQMGNRLGYGKGFYDRYLLRCNPRVMTIGLSWFEPVSAISDINANDVPLKYCLTPHTLYAF